tara:strand:- start:402 stop:563 length:162 start_codon:yes stop_codon:yes gene_type:complete
MKLLQIQKKLTILSELQEKAAYGDIGDQLDEIYKSFDAWKARIKSVKDANPKS